MRNSKPLTILFGVAFTLAGASALANEYGKTKDKSQTGQKGQTTEQMGNMGQQKGQMGAETMDMKKTGSMTMMMSGWPAETVKVAEEIRAKYGEPAEITANMIIWRDAGSFKKTVIYKDAIDHDFPVPHKGILEQTIDYKVPVDRFDDIAHFSGAVIIDKNKGELTARSNDEELNVLALNLADQVAMGKRSWKAARDQFGELSALVMRGEAPREASMLLVDVTRRDTEDRDRPAPQAMKSGTRMNEIPQPIE